MRSETVPLVVGVLGLIRERMDQNLGKIRGVSDIDELQKITLPVHTNGAHTEKVSVHRIKEIPKYLIRTKDWIINVISIAFLIHINA